MAINSGVTLLLPYGNATDATGRNQSGTATEYSTSGKVANTILDSNSKPTYMKTCVVLSDNVILEVYGTLEISGKLSGSSSGNRLAGYTAKEYAALQLKPGSKVNIYSAGKALVYGFIENKDVTASSVAPLVTVYDGGDVYMPLTLMDFKGGTIMSGIAMGINDGKGYAPFHQFYFPNMCAKMRINAGGNMRTWCNLYASNKQNYTLGHLVGAKDSGAFLELTDSTYSYLEATYNTETQITDLDIYGGAKLNSLELTVSVLGIPVTVKSSDFFFGLSWLFDITLDNNESGYDNNGNTVSKQSSASFNMPNNYKMLPGSKLTVESGATLTIGGSMSIYSDLCFLDELGGVYPGTGIYPEVYPTSSSLSGQKLADAKLMVRGNIVANNIGGDIYSDTLGATIIVSGKTRVTTLEPTVVNEGTMFGSVDDDQSITRVLRLVYTYKDGNEVKENEQKAVFPNATFITRTEEGITNWYTDAEISWITITLPVGNLPEGVYITVDPTVLLDENGAFIGMGVYDSREATNHTINVIAGTSILYHLQANHIVDTNNDGVEEVSPGSIKNAPYEYDVEATSSITYPNIYVVPVLKLTGYNIPETCTVTYDLNSRSITVKLETTGGIISGEPKNYYVSINGGSYELPNYTSSWGKYYRTKTITVTTDTTIDIKATA